MSLAVVQSRSSSEYLGFIRRSASFKPKISFELDLKNFVIKTASTPDELREIIRLRQHSFLEDFIGADADQYLDFDDWDLLADHIILKSKRTGEIIGSYRVISSSFSPKLFSSEQFDLSLFEKSAGTKVELGRAVIHKEHRNGLTLSLVWKGIARYAQIAGARYLCGCASTKTLSQRVAESIFWQLYPAHFDDQFRVSVLSPFEHPSQFDPSDLLPWDFVKEAIPPLLKTYLKAGSKICSRPAYDKVFRCVDFFTVLDRQKIEKQFAEKFF